MALALRDVKAVVMARRPEAGRVKTRLTDAGAFGEAAAAELARGMLACIVRRLAARTEVVLAVTPDGAGAELAKMVGLPGIQTIDQGPGDLGERLDRVWRLVGADRPIAFFGGDSPDVPAVALEAIASALDTADIAVGPTDDGGYWTLAAADYAPQVLAGIDWGGPRVYDQTRRKAAEAGLTVFSLPAWHDVDRPEDVAALRRRLADASADPDLPGPDGRELRRLAESIDRVLHASSFALPGQMQMTEHDALTTLADDLAGVDLPDLADSCILLVDDNLQNLELMQAYLEELPCRILTATDGVSAVEQIEQGRPDMVLLDVMMPRMSGFEVCQKIKTSPRTRDIIVIMVTALHEVGDFERAVECGTDDFLTKPVNKLELLTRVKSLLRVRLLKRKLDELMALKQRVSPDDRTASEAGQKLEGELPPSGEIAGEQ